MEIKLKETREELNIEVGDLLVLKNGSVRLLINQYSTDMYACLSMETGTIYCEWYSTVEELLEEYSDNPIVRVIPSSKLEIRELD